MFVGVPEIGNAWYLLNIGGLVGEGFSSVRNFGIFPNFFTVKPKLEPLPGFQYMNWNPIVDNFHYILSNL